MNAALRTLDAKWGVVTALDVDDRLTRAAGVVAVRHGLRGMDSIHLASAMAVADAHPVVVSWDAELRRAAWAEGLAVSL